MVKSNESVSETGKGSD